MSGQPRVGSIAISSSLAKLAPVVTAEEMRSAEAAAVAKGDTYPALMERAGTAVARYILDACGPGPRSTLVLAGPGNNGGDALVVARHLADNGWAVLVRLLLRRAGKDPHLIEPLRQRGLYIEEQSSSATLDEDLAWCDLVVDGLFGTGLQRNLAGDIEDVVRAVNSSGREIVSIDLPSGVDSDTGQVRGSAVRATSTVALGGLKYGHVLEPGKSLAGSIYLGDIGLNTQLSAAPGAGRLMDDTWARSMLPARPDDANKGTFGKVMVVAGSVNYIGAAALAVEGAMRSGAGLVTLGCPGDLLSVLAVKLTECTFLPLPSDLGAFAMPAADKLRAALDGYSALLIGCGIGQEKETAAFLRRLLASEETLSRPGPRSIGFATRIQAGKDGAEEKEKSSLPPLVLDGDALNLLGETDGWAASVPSGSVLTPHPGEMARLLQSSVEEVQADRVKAAREAATNWNQIIVLKGAATVIASPDGELLVSPFSNPALATAGTGDVLAGVIAGLLAQGMNALDAAALGVYLHGLAGEMLGEEYGPSGGLAGELPVRIARAQKRLRENES